MLEKVTIPEGQIGPWKIQRFEISNFEATLFSIKAMHSPLKRGRILPGTYTKLVHDRRGIVMSDTPDEMLDHVEFVRHATGHVMIAGLGIGMVLRAVLAKPDVTRVTVVEMDADVIKLVSPHYQNDRITIIHSSIFDFKVPKGTRYDAVWLDIWDTIGGDNLPEMTKLKRRFSRHTNWLGCWAERDCKLAKKREL